METKHYTRLDYILILALALTALALTILMAWFVTERLPHLEDEIAYLFQARTYARGALWAPLPPDRSAFFTPFVLTLGDRRVGKYPIGWPLVLAVGERFGAGWLVAPVLGALTVALIYALGRELYDRQIGLLAGILALTSPFFLLQSSTYMSHAVACFWATLLAWAFLHADIAREAGRSGRGWAALCGLALGMLTITRALTAVAIALPFGLVLAIRLLRRPRDLGSMIRAYWPMAVLTLAVAALQPLYLYVVTGSPTTNLYTMVWPYDRVGFGPEFGRHGHTLIKGLNNAGRDLKLWTSELFGWQYTSWLPLIPGLFFGFRQAAPGRKVWPILLLAPFVLLVTVHLAYWVGAQVYGPRYYYEAHAGLAILAALGLRGLVRLAGDLFRRLRRLAPMMPGNSLTSAWAAYVVLAALIALNGLTYLPGRLAEWHGLYTITRAPLDELDRLRQTDHVLVIVRSGHWRDYGEFFYLNSPWLDDPIIAAHDVNPEHTLSLLNLFSDREVWYYNAETQRFSKEPDPYPEE